MDKKQQVDVEGVCDGHSAAAALGQSLRCTVHQVVAVACSIRVTLKACQALFRGLSHTLMCCRCITWHAALSIGHRTHSKAGCTVRHHYTVAQHAAPLAAGGAANVLECAPVH